MIRIGSNDEGFSVSWPAGDADAFAALPLELTLEGLAQGRQWRTGLTVVPYGSRLDTLRAILDVLGRLGIAHELDAELADLMEAGRVERELLAQLADGTAEFSPVPAALLEFRSGRTLLDYQHRAVGVHLRNRFSADFSVPGAGKTTVGLATWVMAQRTDGPLRLWVIGPLSCFRPWEEEFEACFARVPSVVRIGGSTRERSRQLRDARRAELVLCSYHTAWREQSGVRSALADVPTMLVLDESHYVKSMHGALSEAARGVSGTATRRLILTGTPMPRSPEDLWSQFTFLWPSEALLGNAQQHAMRCRRPVDAVCEELRRTLSPFFHRTRKSDLGLPLVRAEYPAIAPDEVPATQRLILRLIERRTLEEAEYFNPTDRAHLRRWRKARVVRLLQAASNPLLLADAIDARDLGLVDDDQTDAGEADPVALCLTDLDSDLAAVLRRYRDDRDIPAKFLYVCERVRQLAAAREKVVVWTVFLGNVDLLADMLADLEPLQVTGRVPAYDAADDEAGELTREQRIHLFKTDPGRRVLIANAAACSESISLHRVCQHALYLERSFNAAHFMQSLDRIHRQGMPPGTTANVEIPHMPCAIERVLNRRLSERQQRLFRLLDDPMPVVGFDDEPHQGFFDIEDSEDIDELFEEVLAEIRRGSDRD